MLRCRLVRLSTLGAALVMASACYSYTALPPSGPKLGERVRVRVSGSEAERLESVVGLRDRSLEGDLLEQGDSSIALAVPLPISQQGGSFDQPPQQRIVIPRAEVQDVQLRRLDRLRTSLLVGGVVAGVAAIAVGKGSTLLGNRGPGGSPNETRLPSGKFVLGWSLPVPPLNR